MHFVISDSVICFQPFVFLFFEMKTGSHKNTLCFEFGSFNETLHTVKSMKKTWTSVTELFYEIRIVTLYP